jgi:hypothetical protein
MTRDLLRFRAMPYRRTILLRRFATALLCVGSCVAVRPVAADEGMWPFNRLHPPALRQAAGVVPDATWLEHVRLSSVRFGGASGSFVSRSGLVLTNHHVGSDCIQKLGGKDRDYIGNGFLARAPKEEQKCPDLELNVLVDLADVTTQVHAAATPGMSSAEANVATKAAMTRIEKACAERTGLRCDVVPLYHGGAYDLYTYRKFTDVRLVFAPEGQIAFYGGDPDNFTFPRFDYDAALFRVYVDGQPYQPPHWLSWNPAGGRPGDTVFTSGHPGGTSRLLTVAELEVLRDVIYPGRLRDLARLRARLEAYAKRSPEHERQVRSHLFGVDNGRKAIEGYFAAVKDGARLKLRAAAEAELAGEPAARQAIDAIGKAQSVLRQRWWRHRLLEQSTLQSRLLGIARGLVRLSAERQRPDEQRLREFRGSNLASLELGLYSPAPIYPELEEFLLADQLAWVQSVLGADDPLWRQVMAGKSPAERAHDLVTGCGLADVGVRKQLAADPKALAASQDPMLAMARLLDPEARAVRKQVEDEVEGPVKAGHTTLARAQFVRHGGKLPPDATGTLRLSAGTVTGYSEDDGRRVEPVTTFGGLYARAKQANGQYPWSLPASWQQAQPKLDATTPFNVASTNDIIGGNSGSPVVDRDGKLVGLIFDGNIQSLAGQFWFDERQNRAVWVHARGLLEGLRQVYGAAALVDELMR